MVSSIGSGSFYTLPNWSVGDTSSWQSQAQDLSDLYADSVSDLTNAFSTAAINEVTGIGNLAADAAAKRLGVTLNSSSGSTTPAANPAATATPQSPPPTTSGPSSAYTNIDQFLARLDGVSIPAANASSGTSGSFSIDNFLGGLDRIAAGQGTGAPSTPSGKNFSIDSYLSSLDKITSRPLPIVNITA